MRENDDGLHLSRRRFLRAATITASAITAGPVGAARGVALADARASAATADWWLGPDFWGNRLRD